MEGRLSDNEVYYLFVEAIKWFLTILLSNILMKLKELQQKHQISDRQLKRIFPDLILGIPLEEMRNTFSQLNIGFQSHFKEMFFKTSCAITSPWKIAKNSVVACITEEKTYDSSKHCWRCGKPGDKRKNCRRRPMKFCSRCGKPNILTRDCCNENSVN